MKIKAKKRANHDPLLYSSRPFRRSSVFAFVASLGLWLPRADAEILVDLDATQLAEGPLPSWKNNGTVTGDFASPANAIPNVTTQQAVKGVTLNGPSTIPARPRPNASPAPQPAPSKRGFTTRL